MHAYAGVLLVRSDGAVILQMRDDKPGIENPGLISTFGGGVEPGEEPIEAAVREIREETNLKLTQEQLQFYRKCRKSGGINNGNEDVFYFVATNISEHDLQVYEGTGYAIIRNKQELDRAKTTALVRQVLADYFDGFRSFVLQADMPEATMQQWLEEYYEQLCRTKKPSIFAKPVGLACTGLVASGKSTITAPLATEIGALTISSDQIREKFFRAGYNFKQVRPFMSALISRAAQDRYNIFLDFNISTNMPFLDELRAAGYQLFIVYVNPPESFIKRKILSGNMKHELTFFAKDEFVYESMLGWKHEHQANVPLLKKQYGIWYEVDSSRSDLTTVLEQMRTKFLADLRALEETPDY